MSQAVIIGITLAPQLETTFHGDEVLFTWVVAGLTTWLGWTLPLLAAEWWLERDRVRGRRQRRVHGDVAVQRETVGRGAPQH